MALKDWLRGRSSDESYSVDDLIALERYDEAESQLRLELKRHSRDLHLRLKLADLLMKSGKRVEAVDEYIVVADSYARDGFYDKASALLSKVARLLPNDEKIPLKLEALERLKRFERRRDVVIDSLVAAHKAGEGGSGSSAFELQQLWRNLTESPIIERLSEEQLKRLFAQFEVVRLEENEVVAREGEKREEILLLARGELSARTRLRTGRLTTLRSFAPGQLLGDRALLEHQPWAAEYAASKESVVLRLTRDALERALVGEDDPKGLLDALRAQRNDHQVAASMQKIAESAANAELGPEDEDGPADEDPS